VPTTIVLVRHGETNWNRERRYQGHADTPLNEDGRSQAAELAELLAAEQVTVLYTSPLRRARETAEIIAARLGLQLRTLEALREIDVGGWEGLTIDEVRGRYPERFERDWHSGWEDGETYHELEQRVVPALVKLGSKHDGAHLVGVTHAGPIRAAIAASLGLSYDDARPHIGPLANCALFRFVVRNGVLEPAGIT
jgi:2,3-bisphosphoglycerate-dependent phosphoglycerate mutase